MAILARLWDWLVSLFTRDKVGILFLMLFKSGLSDVASQIADLQLQQKALEFVRQLAKREDLTNAKKATLFNQMLFEYAAKIGKVVCESVLNCLRELAVNALKAERGK